MFEIFQGKGLHPKLEKAVKVRADYWIMLFVTRK